MKDYHINIFYGEEDEGYIADIPNLKFCSAFGSTPEEALKQVQIAKAAWIEAARAEGKPIPGEKRPLLEEMARKKVLEEVRPLDEEELDG